MVFEKALEDASEASPKPFRELPGRVARDAAADGALWPTTVENYPGGLRLAIRAGHSSKDRFIFVGEILKSDSFQKNHANKKYCIRRCALERRF